MRTGIVLTENTEIEQVQNGYIVSFKREGITERRVFTELNAVFTFLLRHYEKKNDYEVAIRETAAAKKQRKQERAQAKETWGFEVDKKEIEKTLEETKLEPVKTV